MKKIFVLIVLALLVLSSCRKKEETKFEAYSPEAFAYNLPEGWEINATVLVKGFGDRQVNSQHSVKIAYSVDLVTPGGQTRAEMSKDTLDENNAEPFNDLQLEAQIELDSTYVQGKYKVVFNIKDLISGAQTSSAKEFEISRQ